jgi:hypothetical protein
MRIGTILTVSALAAIGSTPATAASKSRKMERAPLLSAVTQCRKVAEPASRLACYDKSVAALDVAETARAVVVIDQQQVRETRRHLFGINIPDIGLLGNGADLPQIETTLTSASVDGEGRWTFQLADGARWVQTDDNTIGRRPRANDKIIIKRGALGSFKLSVGSQPGVKVKRQN